MVKKRVKKTSSRAKPLKKTPDVASPRKIRKASKYFLYSLAVFIVSMILFLVTYDFWESIFGLIMILSGALVILFGIIEIIFFFIRRRDAK